MLSHAEPRTSRLDPRSPKLNPEAKESLRFFAFFLNILTGLDYVVVLIESR